MGISLFQHQIDSATQIEINWANAGQAFNSDGEYVGKANNVLAVLPTGAGKTILKAEMARREVNNGGMVVIFAHRDVLLEQISLALCTMGLPHDFIVSNKTKRHICNCHVEEFGQSFYSDRANIKVCSVDMFYRRDLTGIAKYVTLWMMDEAHHLLDNSKWHKCIDPLVHAKGLGVTATPIRADKKGLGRQYHGVFDTIISDKSIGATMHDLIQKGKLSTYKVYTPPPLLDISDVNITSSGDYNNKKLAKATDRIEITGNAIKHYRKLAHNKQAIVFTCNILHSDHVAEQFRKAGYRAVSVSSKTPDAERVRLVKQFRTGEIQILVNCDLFGEGFDVPAVECVIMLRKTESYSLFKQQFGRALRKFDGKQYGVLIDHVGNVERMMWKYYLRYPHDDPEWTLAPQTKSRSAGGNTTAAPNTRVCPSCFNRYEPKGARLICPECGHEETTQETIDAEKAFKEKQGNLVELKIDVIEKIRKEREKIDADISTVRHNVRNIDSFKQDAVLSRHARRQHAQTLLRDQIHKWCMKRYRTGKYDKQLVQQEFEITFQINPIKAAILNEKEANSLAERIRNES